MSTDRDEFIGSLIMAQLDMTHSATNAVIDSLHSTIVDLCTIIHTVREGSEDLLSKPYVASADAWDAILFPLYRMLPTETHYLTREDHDQ